MSDLRKIDVSGMEPVQPASQPAPQLMWVDIESLVIDDRYQRPLQRNNFESIRRIARDFRWSRFQPVLVAPVEGGHYAIIDGQHRAYAAALCGFSQVPAIVALVAPEEQALAFIEVNTRQIRVGGHALYRAALTAGEGWALTARDAVGAAGCRLMLGNASTSRKKPGEIFAIGLIRKLAEGGHAAAITAGLTALREYDPQSVPNFADALLAPWLTAVSGSGIADPALLLAALRVQRPWIVIESATRLAKERGRPVAVAQREAFADLIRRQECAA